MENRSVIHSTFVIERSYPVRAERVFDALSDPVKKRRWFVEGENHDVEEFEMDFRVGGGDRASYRFKAGTPFAGVKLSSRNDYFDIVPGSRIVFGYTMTFGDRCISASLATIELIPDGDATRLIFTEQGAYFEGADGPQIRQAGWGQLLDQLGAELKRPE